MRDEPQILIRLTGVSQELNVGVGAAIASVRTLTDVSVTVRSRELVVFSGGRGGGERALLAVIAGDRRGVSGTRQIHPHARIRALRISTSTALALAQEWQRARDAIDSSDVTPSGASQPEGRDAPTYSRAHDVFLLDVVDDRECALPGKPTMTNAPARNRRKLRSKVESQAHPLIWDERNRLALANWAEVCHRRGGAIVMATNDELGLTLIQTGLARLEAVASLPGPMEHAFPRNHMTVAGRQPASRRGASKSHVRETAPGETGLRVVAMHCGRLAASIRVPTSKRVPVP